MTVKPIAQPIFDPAGRAVIKTTNAVKVIQTEGMHDTAIITLRGESMAAPELAPGTPVQMQYGWQSIDLDTFYGYIDHVETHYDRTIPDSSTLEDVVCLGASYALKEPYIGGWTSVQASSLVKNIVNKYYLSSLIEDDDTVWPQLAAPGESAWVFLTQLATKVGYSLACNKTTMRFTSVDLSMRRYWSTMPIFRSRNTAPDYGQQTMSQFQAITGEALPLNGHTKAVRNVSGIDLTNGHIVNAHNLALGSAPLGSNVTLPFFTQQISDSVVSSQGHAQDVLAGIAQTNRFPYQATATLSGLTTVRQGVPVVISGIDSNNDGTWWVQEVVHKINFGSYAMDVSLGRDALGDNGLRPTQGVLVAYSPSNPFTYTIANAPPTKLINNRWRAAYSSNVDVC